MNKIPRIASPMEITAEWMEQALNVGGAAEAAVVEAVEVDVLDAANGMGTLCRCRLIGKGSGPTPASVMVKLPGNAGLAFRRFAKWFATSRREYSFYRHFAAKAPVRVPVLFYADLDERTQESVLVMEDLDGLETVSQVTGVGPERALAAVAANARLHGRFGENPTADATVAAHCGEFLNAAQRRILQTVYMLALPVALDRFGECFSPETRRLAIDFGPRIDSHLANMVKDRPRVLHGDFRCENLMFGGEGPDDLALIDWQGFGFGCGMYDIGYFLGSSVATEHRRRIEREAIETYHDIVCGMGIKDYTLDECWRSYRQNILGGLILYGMGAGMVKSDDTKLLPVAKESLSRVLAAIEDLDAAEFLPDRAPLFSVAGACSALSKFAYRARELGVKLGKKR